MSTSEQELRNERAALAGAVNARNWEAVKSILHRSFTAQGIGGLRFSRRFSLAAVRLMLLVSRDFQEDVRIDDLKIEGDRAEMTVTRRDKLKVLGVFPKQATDRYRETWEKVDGRWRLRGEEHLGAGTWQAAPEEATAR